MQKIISLAGLTPGGLISLLGISILMKTIYGYGISFWCLAGRFPFFQKYEFILSGGIFNSIYRRRREDGFSI
jgi:hypothetical protein